MSAYRYVYRGMDGTLQEGRVEAPSRKAAFGVLKDRMISPISLEEVGSHEVRGRNIIPRIICIIVCISLLVFLACYLFMSNKPQDKITQEKIQQKPTPRQIVRPPKQPSVKTQEVINPPAIVQPPKPEPDVNPRKPQSNAALLKFDPNARVIPQRPEPPRRFVHDAEEDIAVLLEVKPGDMLVGELKFGKRFLEDFKNSLTNRIQILDSDTPEQKALKEAVIATKEDLRKQMEAGEDICKIMADSRHQLQQLSAYKLDLEAELHDIRKSGEWTAEDYVKFVDAANKMLESKGATPIKLPRVILRQLQKTGKVKGTKE